jgi:hypothetical protein
VIPAADVDQDSRCLDKGSPGGGAQPALTALSGHLFQTHLLNSQLQQELQQQQ